MIKSYWFRILFCGIAAALVGFIIGMVTPKQYDAELQVLVAPYIPVMGGGQSEIEGGIQDIINSSAPRSVNTQVEMLTSGGVLQKAAAKVGNDLDLPYQNPGDELNPNDLRDKISIGATKESDIVTLKVRASSPEIAQHVAAEMYIAFENENDNQSKESANRATKFLNTQNQTIQNKLEAIETEQAKARAAAAIPDINYEVNALILQKRDYETQLETARGEQLAAEARAANLRTTLAKTPQTESGGTSVAENPEYTKLQTLLSEAEAQRDQALTRYTEDSEQVKTWANEITGLQAKLKTTPQYSPNIYGSKSPNPTYGSLNMELAVSVANAKAASERVGNAQAAVDRINQKIDRLPAVQQKLNDLDRQKTVLERISEIYTSKLTTLIAAGNSRSSMTHLLTPATAFPKPSVPNYPLNVGLGFFLGLAVGFLWSIGTESKRNPIRSLGQLNRLSLQPCYRVIPELRVPMRGLGRPTAEAYDSLLVNFVRSEKKGYRLGVLGVTRGAGASTTAMNLAISAARSGYSVLYVESEPGANSGAKLTASAGNVPAENISVYSVAGGASSSGAPISFSNGLEKAAEGKDLVIFDFAPVKASGDAFLVANQLDELLLLVRANVTKSVDFLQAQQSLIDAGCPLVTVTLSRVQDQSDDITALEQQAEIRSLTSQA